MADKEIDTPCYLTMDDEVGKICGVHGGVWYDGCSMKAVMARIGRHRAWQYNRWGANRDIEDGTGPKVEWLEPVLRTVYPVQFRYTTAKEIEEIFRDAWSTERTPDVKPTWLQMVLEEICEAFGEDPSSERLDEELVQVAALCISWLERRAERSDNWVYGVRDVSTGKIVADPTWTCAADVMATAHGFGQGPIYVMRRRADSEQWETMPS